jgi:hypothetical protein
LRASYGRAKEAAQQDDGTKKKIRPEDDPRLQAIHDRLAGKGRVSRPESGPVRKEAREGSDEDDSIAKIAGEIDLSALEGFVMEIMGNSSAAGPLGEFARALKDADAQEERRSARPSVDPAAAKKSPNAMRLLLQLGSKVGGASAAGSAEKKRDFPMLVTRATNALSEKGQEEVRKLLVKRRRLSPKLKGGKEQQAG